MLYNTKYAKDIIIEAAHKAVIRAKLNGIKLTPAIGDDMRKVVNGMMWNYEFSPKQFNEVVGRSIVLF